MPSESNSDNKPPGGWPTLVFKRSDFVVEKSHGYYVHDGGRFHYLRPGDRLPRRDPEHAEFIVQMNRINGRELTAEEQVRYIRQAQHIGELSEDDPKNPEGQCQEAKGKKDAARR